MEKRVAQENRFREFLALRRDQARAEFDLEAAAELGLFSMVFTPYWPVWVVLVPVSIAAVSTPTGPVP